jgi:CBS domain-containing protein
MVVVLTPGSNESKWVGSEVRDFEDRHLTDAIPAYFMTVDRLSLWFNNKQHIDFRNDDNYQAALDDLLNALGWSPPVQPPWQEQRFIDLGIHIPEHRLECIAPDVSIDRAYRKMYQHRFKIRHLLVTEDGLPGSRLVGLLSLRHLWKEDSDTERERSEKKVQDIMDSFHLIRSGPPEPSFNYLTTRDTVRDMLQQFLVRLTREPGTMHIFYMSALPIINEQHCAVGVISFKDVCNAILDEKLPLPAITVGDMTNTRIKTATTSETVWTMKRKMGEVGQRDMFIIENHRRLKGMIPDEIMTRNMRSRSGAETPDEDEVTAAEILVPCERLKLQTPETSLTRMLEVYTPEAKLYYSFAVVDAIHKTPTLLGAVSYLEVFEAVLNA